MTGTRWVSSALLLGALALRCATSENEPDRKKPGGYADSGSAAAGGSAGSGGGSGTGGHDASEAATDAPHDAADANEDSANDGATDAVEAGPAGRVLLVTQSATEVVLGHWSGGAWTTSAISRSTSSQPALVTAAWGGLAVVRDAGDALSFTSWDPGSGAWSAFSPVAAGGATLDSPALAAPGDAHLAFLGTDHKLYANVYSPGSGFQASFSNVEFGGVQSFGPSAPALAATATSVTLAQQGDDGDLYTQLWQGSWQAAFAHGLAVDVKAATPPAAAARSSGSVIVSFIESGTSRVMWTEGLGSSWSSPVALHPSALSPSTPALVALANGDVVFAWRSLDEKVYATTLSGVAAQAPALVHPSLGTTASPALAAGIAGHSAELVWVSGGSVQHSSLGASGWSGPVPVVASGQLALALATYAP